MAEPFYRPSDGLGARWYHRPETTRSFDLASWPVELPKQNLTLLARSPDLLYKNNGVAGFGEPSGKLCMEHLRRLLILPVGSAYLSRPFLSFQTKRCCSSAKRQAQAAYVRTMTELLSAAGEK
jgi:hypothetical protein